MLNGAFQGSHQNASLEIHLRFFFGLSDEQLFAGPTIAQFEPNSNDPCTVSWHAIRSLLNPSH